MPIYRRENGKLEAVAGNFAILNGDALLPLKSQNPSVELYSNHLGVIDDFLESSVVGNGAISEIAATHRIDLTTGEDINSYSILKTKSTWAISSKKILLNYVVQNIVAGSDYVTTQIGLNGFNPAWGQWQPTNAIMFHHSLGAWGVHSSKAAIRKNIVISDVVAGDLLTILADEYEITFYVNGSLVGTINESKYIPTIAMSFGAMVVRYFPTAPSTAEELSIDLIDGKIYR